MCGYNTLTLIYISRDPWQACLCISGVGSSRGVTKDKCRGRVYTLKEPHNGRAEPCLVRVRIIYIRIVEWLRYVRSLRDWSLILYAFDIGLLLSPVAVPAYWYSVRCIAAVFR